MLAQAEVQSELKTAVDQDLSQVEELEALRADSVRKDALIEAQQAAVEEQKRSLSLASRQVQSLQQVIDESKAMVGQLPESVASVPALEEFKSLWTTNTQTQDDVLSTHRS